MDILLEIIASSSTIELRRPSLTGFNRIITPRAALKFLGSLSPEKVHKVLRIQLLRALALDYERDALYGEAIEASKRSRELALELNIKPLIIATKAQEGNLHRRRGKLEEATRLLSEARIAAEETGNTVFNALIEYELGYIGHLTGKYDESIRLLKTSLESAEKERDYLGQLAALGVLSQQYYHNGELAIAEKRLNEAEELIKIHASEIDKYWALRWTANIKTHRGVLAYLSGKLDKAAQLVREGDSINSNRNRDRSGRPTFYYHLGHIYFLKGEYDKAEKEILSSLCEYEETGGTDGREAVAEIIAMLGKIYKVLNRTDEAVERFEQALRLPADLANRRGQCWADLELAKIKIEQNTIAEAVLYIEDALRKSSHHYQPERQNATGLYERVIGKPLSQNK